MYPTECLSAYCGKVLCDGCPSRARLAAYHERVGELAQYEERQAQLRRRQGSEARHLRGGAVMTSLPQVLSAITADLKADNDRAAEKAHTQAVYLIREEMLQILRKANESVAWDPDAFVGHDKASVELVRSGFQIGTNAFFLAVLREIEAQG